MTQNVSYGANFNPNNVFVPGVYQQVIPPQSFFGGAPSSIGFAVGTASWGYLNSPVLISTPTESARAYGTVTAAALTDVHDLPTDISQALSQGGNLAGLALYGVRVADGTQTAAAVTMVDTSGSPMSGITLTGKCTGTLGNSISVITALNAANSLYNVTVVPFAGGGNAELYTGLPATGGGSILTFTGTLTTGNKVNVNITNATLTGGVQHVQFVVTGAETTLTLLATAVAGAINGNGVVSGAGIVATASGATVTITYPVSIGAVNVTANLNSARTATVGGTITATDTVAINVISSQLAGGVVTVSYTVGGGDTTTVIATALRTAINASAPLTAAGITAANTGAVITITTTGYEATTLTTTLSAGATETVTFAAAPTTAVAVTAAAQSNFWSALLTAINQGQGAARPPSNFLVASAATATRNVPASGTITLTGGTDGRSVSSANMLGSNTTPATGMYTAQNVQFQPSIFWICGLTDNTVWSTIQAFADANNMFGMLTFGSGVSTATAVSTKQAAGIADYQIGFIKDWVWWFDQANNQARLIPPYATACGKIASLPPWQSPSNKPVSNIIGTERNNPYSGNTPYSYSELASLGQAGIMVITNPIPRGNVFGFENGYNSVGNNAANAYVEYSRLTNFIVATNNQILGQFVGELQGYEAADPLRAQVRAVVNAFLQSLKQNNYIGPFSVQCSLVNNTKVSIAAHELAIFETIEYLASVVSIFTQVNGGTTVNATSNQLGQQV